MDTTFLLLADVNRMWYAVPLIVAISLVYGATRHETARPIIEHALRFAWWIVSFMAVLFVILWLISRNL